MTSEGGIQNGTRAGGIVSFNQYGKVFDCVNHGDVVAATVLVPIDIDNDCIAGGIAGGNEGSLYRNFNDGSIISRNSYNNSGTNMKFTSAGGIVGRNLGFVERSSNWGNIIAKIASTSTKAGTSSYSTAGGIVGASRGTVSDVFNTGSVTVTKVATASYARRHSRFPIRIRKVNQQLQRLVKYYRHFDWCGFRLRYRIIPCAKLPL